jgi:MYXO-CTERM domain-containing protein
MNGCQSGRWAVAVLAVALLAGVSTPAYAQKGDPGGGPAAGGGKTVGKYKVAAFKAPYETLSDNAKSFSNMSNSAGDLWYYYNQGTISIPAEFNFMFFGQQVTKLTVNAGGVIGIGTQAQIYDNTALPSGGQPNGTLAPFWDQFSGSKWDDYNPNVRWEISGTGDDQILKVEWHSLYQLYCYEYQNFYGWTQYPECETAKHYTFAVWIYTATGAQDSLVQYRYAKIQNPDGSESPYPYAGSMTTTIGIESPDNATGLMNLACGNNCKSTDFPQETVIQFGQGADLNVLQVKGPVAGYAGVPVLGSATVTNSGAADAIGFGLKLWASADTTLDEGDEVMGTVPADVDAPKPDAAGLFTAASDQLVTIDFNSPLPRDLEEGKSYYMIAEVDPASANHPAGLVREDVETNNTGVYGPFLVGPPTPDLSVSDIVTDKLTVAPGTPISVSWKLTNSGNLPVDGVPFYVVLSVEDVITPSDTVIGNGFLKIDELSSMDISLDNPDVNPALVTFQVPATTRPGVYHLGIVIDPLNETREVDDFNNVGILADLVLIGSDTVSVATTSLPPAYVGAPYCERLQAAGGNGVYVWTSDASKLPPGLSLREEPADARAKGKPYDTLLCGTPSIKGAFTFSVDVTSAAKKASKSLTLNVEGEVPPLSIVTSELPAATFQVGYEASLYATGGAPPYTWALQQDTTPLPRGVSLRGDGRLTGMPQLDGRFPFKVQVTDTAGKTVTTQMSLSVTPPGRLTCVSQALDSARVGEEYVAQLFAAGGNKPYIWSTVESRRLAEGVTDPGETTPDVPPPGLVLAESGSVSGTPASAGSYLWTARVTDQAKQEDVCILSLDFASGNLNVTTAALPVVCTSKDYNVQLEASGGDGGFLTWSVDSNSELPEGIELTPDGLLTGNVSAEVLEGNSNKTFNVTVHVKDSSNAKGLGAVALRLEQCKTVAPPKPVEITKTGCGSNAGSGAPAFIGLAALALLGLRRRK